MNEKTEAEAIEGIVRRTTGAKRMKIARDVGDAVEVLLVPQGNGQVKVESVKRLLDEYRDRPERRTGQARMTDLASFIAHVQRFRDDDSALFANTGEKPSLLCVFDYHEGGPADSTDPRFGTHRSIYEFPLSDEWNAWTEADGEPMSQQEFAEFIENRLLDVIDPSTAQESARAFAATLGCTFASPSKLLELSRGLSVRVGQSLRQHTNLSTGEVQLQYEAQHTTESGGPLKVPGAFLIAVPIFRNGARYQIPVRLRYRVQGAQVSWFFEMFRADAAIDDAVREACEEAKNETKLPLFAGSPEA